MTASSIFGFSGGSPSPAPAGEPATSGEPGTAGEPAAAPQGGTPAATQDAPPVVDSYGLSPAQLRQMAQWAVEDGHLSQEQADAALREAGAAYSNEERAALSEDPTGIDTAFPPARANEFEFPSYGDGKGIDDETIRAADTAAREWLVAGRFTKGVGDEIARQVNKTAEKWEAMHEPQRGLYRREQEVILERMWGDRYSENVALARQLVDKIEAARPGFVETLILTGAGNNAVIVGQMYMQAARLREQGRL